MVTESSRRSLKALRKTGRHSAHWASKGEVYMQFGRERPREKERKREKERERETKRERDTKRETKRD